MATDSSQLTRHSVRDFSDRPVDLEVLKAIIAEAQHAPSWEDAQPWKVYLAVGQAAAKLRQTHADKVSQQQKSWADVVPPKVWADRPQHNIDQWQQSMQHYMGDELSDFMQAGVHLFNAPAIIYITIPKNATQFSAYDAGGFGYGILLAAEERGISGVPAYQFVRYPEEVRQAFEIPDDEAVFMGIGLGYPTDKKLNTLKTNRVPLADMLQIRQ